MILHGDALLKLKELADSGEMWAPIAGFDHYWISSKGRVFNSRRGSFKKACADKKGYMRVRFIDGSIGSTKKVHRLVAEAFIHEYCSTLQVNHKNCIKSDNRIENLEMANQSQNTAHAWRNKRMKLTRKGKDGKFTKA